MSSEEDSVSSSISLTEEKKFIIKTDKNNEMDLFLRIYNNDEFAISIYRKNEFPARKYEFKCNLEEIQKNRFFRIFINVDEIMKELEHKIKKSTFIEEKDLVTIEIPIGLIIIDSINLNIQLVEKTCQEINEDLKTQIQEQIDEINELKNKINDLENNINTIKNDKNNLNNQIKEKEENNQKLNEEINQLKIDKERITKEKIGNNYNLKIKL